tara:strand:- start:1047 stop:2687 length:1641 start_codon:yes stop_codon:yes gene_type:complete
MRADDDLFAEALDRSNMFYMPGAEMKLRPIQAYALSVLGTMGGLLGAIGVGHGKTLVAILGACMVGARRPVVMVPPSLKQTFLDEYEKFAPHFKLPYVQVIAYSTLSSPGGWDLLNQINPDYIFADEAHCLRHVGSARTRRLLRYLDQNPEVVFAAASGTLTARSVRDYAHLAKHALGFSSPLPVLTSHLDSWANVLDVDGRPSPTDWSCVEPLLDTYGPANHRQMRGEQKRDAARAAFCKLLTTTAGVVTTDDESAPCSLLIHCLHSPAPPHEIVDAMESVRQGTSPNGEEVFEDDASVWRALRQVSAGFYYRWAWELTPQGRVDHEWLEARSHWSRWVRRELETQSAEGYDSPAMVKRKVQAEIDARPSLVETSRIHSALHEWEKVSHRSAPPTVPVWLSHYMIDAVIDEVSRHDEPVLVWYETRAVGEALASATGWPLHGPGNPPGGPAKTCLVSINAHHKGLNLQAWRLSVVVEPPSSGQVWEQLIGRTHRAGQTADEVEVFTFVGPEPFASAFASARKKAAYAASTTGGRMKLVFAPVIQD